MAKDTKPVPKQPDLLINVPEALKGGVYSNLVVVTTTSNMEVMIDFIFSHPNEKDENNNLLARVVSRVVLPLRVAQDMKLVMESQLGKIKKE